MNWRRGAFRLWIVASIFWTALVSLLALPDIYQKFQRYDSLTAEQKASQIDGPQIKYRTEQKAKAIDKNSSISFDDLIPKYEFIQIKELKIELLNFFAFLFIPIFLVFLLGWSAFWISNGFKKN